MLPKELTDTPNWVLWKTETNDKGKVLKTPYSVNGYHAKSNDASTWTTYEAAKAALNDTYSGLGFQAGETPVGWLLFDLDDCFDEAENLSDDAQLIIKQADSYTEYSPSDRGLHIFAHGVLPGGTINASGFGEAYDRTHYFTVTDRPYGDRVEIRTLPKDVIASICGIYERRRASKKSVTTHDGSSTVLRVTSALVSVPVTPEAIIKAMIGSLHGATILSLYNGDVGDDHSKADAQLCGYLAYWCNKDAALMDAVFRTSKLMREKWDESHYADGTTYGEGTITFAINGCKETVGNKLEPDVQVVSEPWSLDQMSVTSLRSVPEPQEYVIPGLLPRRVLGVLPGEGGASKKSMAMLTLGIQGAITGVYPQKWLGKFELNSIRTLYVSLEDHREQVQRRMHAIIDKFENKDEVWPLVEKSFFVLGKELFNDTDHEKLVDGDGDATSKHARFLSTITELQPDLIIIDTKSKATAVEENANQLNSSMMDHMDTFCGIESKPAVILVSHVSKGVRSGKESHAMNATRGAGALADDSRWIMWFKPIDDTLIEVIHVKNSYGSVADPVVIEFKYPNFKLTDKTPETVKDAQNEEKKAALKADIRAVLENGPISKNTLAGKLHKGKALVILCADEMEADGVIEFTGKSKTSKCQLKVVKSDQALK